MFGSFSSSLRVGSKLDRTWEEGIFVYAAGSLFTYLVRWDATIQSMRNVEKFLSNIGRKC